MGNWVLVVDDDANNLRMASRILVSNGMRASCVRSGTDALRLLGSTKELPDLILLDIHMPGPNGFETLEAIRSDGGTKGIPVIFLTADEDAGTETRGLMAGAMDFITKPFVPEVLLTRVNHIIELTRLQNDLSSQVTERTKALIEQRERVSRLSMQMARALAGAVDAKDTYTNSHSERVATYAREIARRYGYTPERQRDIYMIGLLHDVGKIGIPDTILSKPGKLDDDEFAVIKTHPVQGDKILHNIPEFPELAIGARWHHERYDGRGYPDGIAGTDIPEEARIIAVADAYDAMSSTRSYRPILSQQFIRQEIVNGRGTQFDPVFADIMLQMMDEDVDYQMSENYTQAALLK